MLAHRLSARRFALSLRLICTACIVALIAGCQGSAIQNTQISPADSTQNDTAAQATQAEVTFISHLPAKLADGQNLYLEILDEVTGLAMNPLRAKMETQDQINYAVKVPFILGSVVKYRYVRDKDPVGMVEYNSLNQQVRYRLYVVEGPGVVHDTVTGWKTSPTASILGRIRGQVANKKDNSPVVNALVEAGGVQTFTASDGSFLLEGLPPGTHNLVVYSLNGAYQPFQQGAVVASESTTPANITLTPSKMVNVTFLVHPPQDNIKNVPIHLVGNLITLGNTFSDLKGGLSTLASRAPQLAAQPDGTYLLKMKLAAGLDLRYKYSLGDGFWNAEHTANGEMRVRHVIVPDQDMVYEDTIDTWKTNGFAPISFTVNVPADTPSTNIVSIQFNPFGWTEPIPMWATGKNRWSYVLYSPLDAFGNASYRYCRNEQCGSADAADTSGSAAKGIAFTPKNTEQSFSDTVSTWAWLGASGGPVTVPGTGINARKDFQAGVELMTGYQPSWQAYMASGFQNIKDIGANTVMLTPTWHATRQAPPVIEQVAGKDPTWFDASQMVSQARQKGLDVTIHPVLLYDEDPSTWWQNGTRDEGWWQTWFARYRTFILYHADLAAQTGAKALVIGDASILLALPGGLLADDSASGAPANAGEQWSQLIKEVRSRFTGKVVWMLPDNGTLPTVPDFIKEIDAIYVPVSAPLVNADQNTQAGVETGLAALLDGDILKAQEKTGLPVLIGLQYPSVSGAATSCANAGSGCLSASALNRPSLARPEGDLSLQEQANIYSAALGIINQRSWVNGVYAVGYNPAVELRDGSLSVRSKPASDVLWYWFPRLTGVK